MGYRSAQPDLMIILSHRFTIISKVLGHNRQSNYIANTRYLLQNVITVLKFVLKNGQPASTRVMQGRLGILSYSAYTSPRHFWGEAGEGG